MSDGLSLGKYSFRKFQINLYTFKGALSNLARGCSITENDLEFHPIQKTRLSVSQCSIRVVKIIFDSLDRLSEREIDTEVVFWLLV